MKPILFSTPMVQAILEGRKTQTRRVMKPANPFKVARMGGYSQGNGLWVDGYKPDDEPNGHVKDYSISSCWMRKKYYIEHFAPYAPGDILWVRETWAPNPIFHGEYLYRAFANQSAEETDNALKQLNGKWRPSIHMPRAAARIFLRVTDVRVERVQEITYGDCCAEGVFDRAELKSCFDGSVATEKYRELWDTLNAKRSYGWDANPWVWVYEFERANAPEGLKE